MATGGFVSRHTGAFASLTNPIVVTAGSRYALASCCVAATPLVIIDGTTGAVVQRWTVDAPSQPALWAVDADHVMIDLSGTATAVDITNGRTTWQHRLSRPVQAVAHSSGSLLVLAADPVLYCR